MPLKYHSEAFEAATFLNNRMPTAVSGGLSPLQKLFGVKPDYGALRVFGCACFPLLRPYNSYKLSYISTKCIFMGYILSEKGYKCLDPTTHKVYIFKYVVFNENNFPFSRTQSSTTSPSLSHCHIFTLLCLLDCLWYPRLCKINSENQ